MNLHFTLLIADARKSVREFLAREMSHDGYRVLTAKNGREIILHLKNDPSIDLLIIDPSLPDVNDWAILDDIGRHAPARPVIIHTFISEYAKHTITTGAYIFVEKRGNSVDSLKKTAEKLLKRSPSAKGKPFRRGENHERRGTTILS